MPTNLLDIHVQGAVFLRQNRCKKCLKYRLQQLDYRKRAAQENIHSEVLFKKSCQSTICIFTKNYSSEEFFLTGIFKKKLHFTALLNVICSIYFAQVNRHDQNKWDDDLHINTNSTSTSSSWKVHGRLIKHLIKASDFMLAWWDILCPYARKVIGKLLSI